MSADISELRRKAESGSITAQSVLGTLYLHGVDVEQDYAEAYRWLSAAVEQGGTSRAVLNLADMHAKGLGITQNVSEAVRLYTAVARPDDSSDAIAARMELGRIYSKGLGDVRADPRKAHKWFSAAVALASGDDDTADLREARAYLSKNKKKK